MQKPTDYFDNEIDIGDIVAYATSSSSSVAMNHGEVLSIRPFKDTWSTKLRFKLSIRKLGQARYGSSMEDSKTERPVHITELSRCINLSKFDINQ
jgi:hypothetical protein